MHSNRCWETPFNFPTAAERLYSLICTEELEHMNRLGLCTAFLSPRVAEWCDQLMHLATLTVPDTAVLQHRNMRPPKEVRWLSQVVVQVYCSPMTHQRVFQVFDTLTIGLQWPQTTLLDRFSEQSCEMDEKGLSVLSFMELYAICDRQVISSGVARWACAKSKPSAVGLSLP